MLKQKIFFKNSLGQKLVGILYKPESKENFPITIFCHGYKSSKETLKAKILGEKLTKKGIGLFAFDFSGNGESEGEFKKTTITQYIDDLKCAVDLISKKTDNIALVGSSQGGLVSLNAASKDKRIKTLVLLSPLSHFRGQIKKYFKRIIHRNKYNKYKVGIKYYTHAFKYMGLSRYKKIDVPTLIIHGDEDTTINLKDSIRLNRKIKSSNLIIIEGSDHRYSKKADFNKVINKTTDFIVNNLK